MKKLFLLMFLFVFAGAVLLAQTKVITGTVTSAVEGEGALPGVSVSVTGTTIGAITDINGKYSIPNVPVKATTLTFSYIGMKKQEVEIGGRSVIDVLMQPEILGLNEVVVTAFGIKRQAKEIGVATAQVTDKQLTQAGITNVVNGLTGKVSGLQINTVNNGVNPETRITLRGNRHFLASNQALIVLDGVPVSAGYLNSINPNDIANINVLKGASASALYGNDASNGVLVITTRRGAGNIPVIKISNTTTFESISYLPKLQERFGSGSGEDTANALPAYTFWIGPDRNTEPYTSYENQSYGPEFNGQDVILGGVLVDGSYQMVKYSPVKNQKKSFFSTGVTMQNDVSYAVGDDNNSFYFSAQDVKTTGTVPGDKNRRTGIRVSGARTTGIFKADYSLGYTQTNTDVSGDEYYQRRPVYWAVLNTPMHINFKNYKDVDNNKFAHQNGYFNAYYPNPYWQLKHSRYNTTIDNVLGSALFQLKPAKWLDIGYRVGIVYSGNNRTYFRDGVTYNSYQLTDPWEAGGIGAISPFPGVSWENLSKSFSMTGDLLVQLNQKFGDFSTKLILGNSLYSYNYKFVQVNNNSIVIPNLYNITNRLGEPGVDESNIARNSIGLFADFTLGYKDFAFVHASARNDWDSRLVKENRSFFYPGVDASLILTNMIPALQNNSVLSFMKLRGGWSKTGQITLSDYYATLPSFGVSTGFPYGSVAGFSLSTALSNPKLKPELTTEYEGGVEAGLFKSRVNFDINYYISNTKDQTIPATVPFSTGYGNAYINSGQLETQGIETDLRLTPLLNLGDFAWNLTVSYTWNTSLVVSIMEGLDELTIQDVSYAIKGQQFPAIKIVDWTRDSQGRIVVDASTGYPVRDPALQIVGHGNPNHILGIVNTFTFKGLSLNVVADYRYGNVILNRVGDALDFTGTSWHSAQNGRQNFLVPNSVYQTGKDAAGKPIYAVNTNIITKNAARGAWVNSTLNDCDISYLSSAAFWKLREVSLAWDLPVRNVLGGRIKAAQVGLVGRNLVMLRPKTNTWTDPEFNLRGGTSNAVGFTTEDQTPATRIYGFSVKLTF
jgi:TonB-linked SusC/RagA family outer membrane protein